MLFIQQPRIHTVLAELRERACPSIRYRLRREILNQPPASPDMTRLQVQILEDPSVKEVAAWQGEDGWLAWDFHGTKSTESGIRLLAEKGLAPTQPLLRGALDALERETGRLARGIGKPGAILDERGVGGAAMIRAATFACAGIEDRPFIREQIALALASFQAVTRVASLDEVFEHYLGGYLLKENVPWPGIYTLRLLAWTQSWRSPQNNAMIAGAAERLVQLSPLPAYHLRRGSQLIAPPSFCMDTFRPQLTELDDAGWMMAFHRLELLARLGVIHSVAKLERQAAELAEMLEAGEGFFTKRLAHPYFRNWGAYTGLMLEQDWKVPRRREYDLTFRSLLILSYAEK